MELRVTKTGITATLVFAGIVMTGSGHAATTYKWTDAEGNVHYSQTPPENNTESETMDVGDKVRNSGNNGGANPANNNMTPPASAGQDPRAIEARKRNCEIARKNLQAYKQFKSIRQADGTSITLTEEMRAQKVREAQQMVDSFCR